MVSIWLLLSVCSLPLWAAASPSRSLSPDTASNGTYHSPLLIATSIAFLQPSNASDVTPPSQLKNTPSTHAASVTSRPIGEYILQGVEGVSTLPVNPAMSATARSYSVTSYGTPLASHASLGLASSHSIGFFAPSTVGLDRSISRITSGNSEGATIPTSRMLKHDVTGPQEHFNTTTFTFRPSRSSNGSFTQLGHYPVANITRSTLSYDGYNSTTFSYLPSGHVPSHNNGTNSTAKLCWAEWASYWSHPTNTTSTEFQYLSSQTVIDVTTATAVQAGFAGATFTYSSGVNTQTITDNGWTILDVETLAAATTIILPAEPTKTVYETWTITSLARVTTAGVSTHVATITAAPSPSCRLPHRVPQCQSEWDSWISIVLLQAPSVKNRCNTIPVTQPRSYQSCLDNLADDPAQALALSVWARKMAATGVPHCPQASMPADVCTALVDGYASGQNLGFVELTSSAYGPKDIQQLGRPIITSFSNGYLQSNDSGAWAWPTHSTLAPGCTVGCGRCTVAGDHVKLLYWPPTPTNMTRAPNAAPLTAVFQNVTLTSPTLYISYNMLHASDACSAVGATHYNTIVPVYNQSALSSQFSSPVPSTSAQWSNLYYSFTAPFNISDLYQTPVPKSIYTSQPWCASWAVEHGSLYGPRAEGLTAWDCPATRPYEPILVVDPAWYSRVDPAWASCHADMSGHYDPPIALTPAAIVATPTAPAPITAPSPAEASSTPTVAAATALSANIDTLLSSTQTVTRSPSEASVAGVSATISSAEPIDTSRSTAIRATPSIAAEPSSTANVQNLASAIAAAASSLGVVPATSTAVQTNNQADPDIADATSSADVQNLLSGIGLVATAASQSSADGGEPSVVAAPEVSAGSIVTPQSTDAAARQSAFGTASANDPQVSASPLVASGSSQVLSAGPISTLNGDPVSKGPGGAVVSSVQTVTPGLATTVHGVAFSVPTGGLVVFGGDQTLSVGQLTTLSGDVISVGSDGVAINFAQTVAQGKVTTIQETIFANPTIAPAVIGSDGQSLDDLDTSDAEDASSLIVTLAPDGDYVVQGHTLTPGIGSITIGSGTYQALPSGSGVLLAVGGATTTLLPDAALGAAHGPVVALASDGDYVVQGQTLAPGSVVMTIGSSTYRALPSGAGILLAADGATTTLVPAAVETIADFTAADGHTLAVALEAASRIAIVNNTLTLNMNGPGTVIGGESVRLDSGGLVVNGITETWSLSTSTPTSSITSASEPGSKSMNTAPSQSAANATPTSQISGASQIWTPFSIGALIAILALSTSIGALG